MTHGEIEVALCFSRGSRDEVERMAAIAGPNGGTVDVNPPEGHSFMMTRGFIDPDRHVREPTWMDPTFVGGEAATNQSA